MCNKYVLVKVHTLSVNWVSFFSTW